MSPIIVRRSYTNIGFVMLPIVLVWWRMFSWKSHYTMGILSLLFIGAILLATIRVLNSTPALIIEEKGLVINLIGGSNVQWIDIESVTLQRRVRAGYFLEIVLRNGSTQLVSVSSLDMSPTQIHRIITNHLEPFQYSSHSA